MSESRYCGPNLIDWIAISICVVLLFFILGPPLFNSERSGRRAYCQNNLRQLVLAATNFDATCQRLPTNRRFRDSSSGPITVGWAYDLLPYLEQQQIYDLLKRDAVNVQANSTKIPILICPNDPTISRATDTSYQVNGGCPNNPSDNFDVIANGVSDDLAGEHEPKKRAQTADVRDGATYTIFYAENLNAQRWNEDFYHAKGNSREYFHAISWVPVEETQLDSAFCTANEITSPRQLWAINEGDSTRFGPEFARPSSYHPTGFQAAFVGGQTRFINETIDYEVYARLLSGDGERTLDPRDQSLSKTTSVRQWQREKLLPQQYE